MNVIEFIRFCAMLIIAGALFRLVELKWGADNGFRGTVAQGLGTVY
jgi:hypothetical protein